MDAVVTNAYQKLLASLEEMTKLYRQLLEIVRNEKEILLKSDLNLLQENNSSKDTLLVKLRMIEMVRMKQAQDLAATLKMPSEAPRLLEIAKNMGQTPESDRLRSLHGALELLVKRITEVNKDNEQYAQSALKTLNGTMNDIKETLSGKKTYERKGQYKLGPDQSGNFVSREA